MTPILPLVACRSRLLRPPCCPLPPRPRPRRRIAAISKSVRLPLHYSGPGLQLTTKGRINGNPGRPCWSIPAPSTRYPDHSWRRVAQAVTCAPRTASTGVGGDATRLPGPGRRLRRRAGAAPASSWMPVLDRLWRSARLRRASSARPSCCRPTWNCRWRRNNCTSSGRRMRAAFPGLLGPRRPCVIPFDASNDRSPNPHFPVLINGNEDERDDRHRRRQQRRSA